MKITLMLYIPNFPIFLPNLCQRSSHSESKIAVAAVSWPEGFAKPYRQPVIPDLQYHGRIVPIRTFNILPVNSLLYVAVRTKKASLFFLKVIRIKIKILAVVVLPNKAKKSIKGLKFLGKLTQNIKSRLQSKKVS